MNRYILSSCIVAGLFGCGLDDSEEPAVLDDTGAGPSEGEFHHGLVDTALGELAITYQVRDGLTLYQGDIQLDAGKQAGSSVATRTDTDYRWPNAVIPYQINQYAYNAAGIDAIEAAIAEWNATTIMWFVPLEDLPAGYTDYVYFTGTTTSGCNSWVGRQGTGRQIINIGAGCFSRGTILHEMGHAAGLWHEQSRADRDDHVIVHEDNIINNYWISQFNTYVEDGDDGQDLYEFDFSSAMLYPSFASSIAKDPTKPIMTDLYNNTWGAPDVLSVNDISGITRFQSWPSSGRTYMLQFVHSGKCLDVEGASRVAGRNVNQFQCHGGANQRWHSYTVPWQSDGRILIGENSGQCLDIVNGSTADGARLRQFPCQANGNQRYELIGDATKGYVARARHSGLCLTVDGASTANGAWVRQRACTGAANQRLRIVY